MSGIALTARRAKRECAARCGVCLRVDVVGGGRVCVGSLCTLFRLDHSGPTT